jgi:hypothetical protein
MEQLESDLRIINAVFDSVYAKVPPIEKQIKKLEEVLLVQRGVVEEVAQVRDKIIESLRVAKAVPHKKSHESSPPEYRIIEKEE